MGFYNVSIGKTVSKKTSALIYSMKLNSKTAYYFDRSFVQCFMLLCTGFCFYFTAEICRVSLQKQLCTTVEPTLALISNHWIFNKIRSNYGISISINLRNVFLNWLKWYYFFCFVGGLFVRLHDLLYPFTDEIRLLLLTTFFHAQLDLEILLLQNVFLRLLI